MDQPKSNLLKMLSNTSRSQNETRNLPNQFQGKSRFGGGEVEYYNDLPGKSPPDFSTNAKVQSQPGPKDSEPNAHARDRGPGFRQRPFRGTEYFDQQDV